MDFLERFNEAISYLEANLCGEIEIDQAARIACVTKDSFLRFFSYMAGMTLKEYLRRRRLTLAALELQGGKARVIDIAVKYGWSSADAFARAFSRQHGITPTQARDSHESLQIYPPASFYISIKGAKKMEFRLNELEETQVWGVSKQFDGQGYETREELRHIMWSEDCDDVPGQICEGCWNQPGNTSYDGVWYGIWQDGAYMIAREQAKGGGLESRTLPAGTYAAFRTKPGGLAWEEFPKLLDLVLNSWLPSSGYRQKGDLLVEVLHLWTDHGMRQKNRYYEVWVPVTRTES